jgi:hypothetical protein
MMPPHGIGTIGCWTRFDNGQTSHQLCRINPLVKAMPMIGRQDALLFMPLAMAAN